MTTPPFRYVGGKSWLAPAIVAVARRLNYARYIEPCLGGGAVFFALADDPDAAERPALLADANADLIALYGQIDYDPEGLWERANTFAHQIRQADLLAPDEYRKLRATWNAQPEGRRDTALTLVLHAAAFNGISRRNRKGENNVPPRDKLAQLSIPTLETLAACSAALSVARIVHGSVFSLHVTCSEIEWPESPGRGDLLFIDPPYLGTFDKYQADGFSLEQHRALVSDCGDYADRGAHVIYCNQHTPAVVELLTELWPDSVAHQVAAPRRVSANGDRKPATEIIVTSASIGSIEAELALLQQRSAPKRSRLMATRKKKTDTDSGGGVSEVTGSSAVPDFGDFPATTWPVLTRLTTNVKSLHPAPLTRTIGPKVAFLGNNWSGKTALDNAIRLAWAAELPSPLGKSGSALMKLAPKGAEELLTLLTDESGEHGIGVRVPITKGREAKTPELIATGAFAALSVEHRHALMPIVGFRAMIRMESIKAREEFARRFGGDVKVEPPRGMSETQRAVWASVYDATKPGATGLAGAANALRLRQPEVTRKITPLEKQIADLRAEGVGGAEMIGALESELAEARAEDTRIDTLREAARVQADFLPTRVKATAVSAFVSLKASADAAVALWSGEAQKALDAEATAAQDAEEAVNAIDASQREIESIDKQVAAIPAPPLTPEDERDLEGVARLAESLASMGSKLCPCCQRDGTDLKAVAAGYRQSVLDMRALDEVANAQRVTLAAKRKAYEEELVRRRMTANHATRQLDAARQRVGSVEAQLSSALAQQEALVTAEAKALAEEATNAGAVAEASRPPPVVIPERTHRPIVEIETQLDLSRAAASRVELVAKIEIEVMELKTERADVELLNKAARARLVEAMLVVKSSAEKAINAKLQPGFRFELMLGDGDECRCAIIGSDGEPHEAGVMTGSDEMALTVALMRAWKKGGLPSIVLLDDAEVGPFDNENFTALLAGLARAQEAGEIDMVAVACWRDAQYIPPGYLILNNAPRPRSAAASNGARP